MPYEYRTYWDRVGHKRNCPTWGDEHMIYSCTCGVPPQTVTGRFLPPVPNVVEVYPGGTYAVGGGGGGSYHNPGTVTIGVGYKAFKHVDVDFPGIENRLANKIERGSMNRRETIKARMRQLEEELAKIDRFPQDTFANGTVIKFDKLFDISWEQYDRCEQAERDSITVYTYAAIKANGYWYCSGQPNRSPQRVHWDALIEWMGDGVKEVWLLEPNEDILSQEYRDARRTIENMKAGAIEAAPLSQRQAKSDPTEQAPPTTDADLSRSYQELGD